MTEPQMKRMRIIEENLRSYYEAMDELIMEEEGNVIAENNQLEGWIVGYGEDERPMTWDDLNASKQQWQDRRKQIEAWAEKVQIQKLKMEWARLAIQDVDGLFRRLRPLPVPDSCDGPSPESSKIVQFSTPAA